MTMRRGMTELHRVKQASYHLILTPLQKLLSNSTFHVYTKLRGGCKPHIYTHTLKQAQGHPLNSQWHNENKAGISRDNHREIGEYVNAKNPITSFEKNVICSPVFVATPL